jgi:hypothetical protein
LGTAVYGQPALKVPSGAVGKNLQGFAAVELSEPAPEVGGLQITITSADPARLLVSNAPDKQGSGSIVLNVRPKFRGSPQFWLQALGDSGEVEFTASAPGYAAGTGKVTLTPSAITIDGPLELAEFSTTPRAWPSKIMFRAARLDESLEVADVQPVRGGLSVEITVSSSDPKVGRLAENPPPLTSMQEASMVDFRPGIAGSTTLEVSAPGFRSSAKKSRVVANVKLPGIGITDDHVIGKDLQIRGVLSLGEQAPESGVSVTLTSNNPESLLISRALNEPGKPSLTVEIPGKGIGSTYYLQALAGSGTATYTATAPNFRSRTATVKFAPSGIVIMLEPAGPPDEAEIERPESAGEKEHVFFAETSQEKPTPLMAFTAFLDPKTRRAADVTVQPLRAGVSASCKLTNSNPRVGKVDSTLTIPAGLEYAQFLFSPLSAGETRITITLPERFTTPSNGTVLRAVVK